jgi:hypothetical protein
MHRHWHADRRHGKSFSIPLVTLLTFGAATLYGTPAAQAAIIEVQNLDGSGNNTANPQWGRAGTPYSRVAPARYADGRSAPVTGPSDRRISNRIFNDIHQNIFSEDRVTQWGFTWGQFLDHTFGLRQGGAPGTPGAQTQNIPFDSADPLETFQNDLGVIPFARSDAAPGTGVTNPREQVNTISSYLDAAVVYGGTNQRLEWLREGPVDGNLANNGARLLMPGSYLPRRDSRGAPASAPASDVDGRLLAQPNRAAVAGDVRVNENIALQATQTLFAREHNRIVSLLPTSLSEEDRFQIARRVVIAEQQYITYNEFLPAMGVQLPLYTGYKSNVNANLSNEFATVGYRAHSMIHGEMEVEADAARYTAAQISAFQAQGIGVAPVADNPDEVALTIPLNVAFFNPDLVEQLQLGPLLQAIGLESEYKNDEQIDNQLRSVLFQVPVSANPDCLDALPPCFRGVVDLAAIDIERGRDHGMPSYNQLRQAYGLAPKTSFTAITGEASETFPSDPLLTPGNEINDPNSLDFVRLANLNGEPVTLGSDASTTSATTGVRRTTVASRLRAVYGSVNNVDAFVGMSAEQHVPGSEFGELQRAIWTRQFQALRDGDRFFYGNDPGLSLIKQQYGLDFRRTLGEVIGSNSDIPVSELNSNVFLVADADLPPATCRVAYTFNSQWNGGFQVGLTVTNLGTAPVNGWTLRWQFADGQTVSELWNGGVAQSGANVAVTNAAWNGSIPGGGTVTGVGFNARWDNAVNPRPPSFTLNNARCAVG